MRIYNKVPLPVGITTPLTSQASITYFTRNTEDGEMVIIVDPDGALPFNYDDVDELYKGSVKGFKLVDDVETLVTNYNEPLSPGNFYLKNGLVLLSFETDGIEYYCWDNDSEDYVFLDKLQFGTINLIQPIVINSIFWKLRVENITIILSMGRPFIHLKHEFDDLDYTLRGNYAHDNILSEDVGADANISMEDTFFCKAYDDNDTFGLIIAKFDPTNIKSDNLPADELTAIGHYNLTATGHNTSNKIAGEMFLNNALFKKINIIGS